MDDSHEALPEFLPERRATVTIDMSTPIPDEYLKPGIIDPLFTNGRRQTIFLAADVDSDVVSGQGGWRVEFDYVNSEQLLLGSDTDLWQRALQAAGSATTPEFYQCLLRLHLGNEALRLRHIISGVNSTTFDPYLDLGYDIDDEA